MEILEELPKLSSIDLEEVRDRIWQLEEQELLGGRAAPSADEKLLLDRELRDYAHDPEAGATWEEIQSRLMQ